MSHCWARSRLSLLLCALLLPACARAPIPLHTVTEFRVEKQKLPDALLEDVAPPDAPDPAIASQKDVAEYLVGLHGVIETLRAKLESIRELVKP